MMSLDQLIDSTEEQSHKAWGLISLFFLTVREEGLLILDIICNLSLFQYWLVTNLDAVFYLWVRL